MRFDEPLRVKHTVSVYDKPLVCFDNLPGYDAEMNPEQVRALAQALLKISDDCEALRGQTRAYGPARREYPLADVARARAKSEG